MSGGARVRFLSEKASNLWFLNLIRRLTSLKESDCVVLDPRHSVVFFDGNNPHSVKPYAGEERYSMALSA